MDYPEVYSSNIKDTEGFQPHGFAEGVARRFKCVSAGFRWFQGALKFLRISGGFERGFKVFQCIRGFLGVSGGLREVPGRLSRF